MLTFSKKKYKLFLWISYIRKISLNCSQISKKIQNHTKLLQLEGAAPVHTRSQAKRNSAGLSRRKEAERKRREQCLCSTLGQPARAASPTSTPSFLCSHTRCTARRWTRSLGEQAAYAAPSKEAVGSGGGNREAEVIQLVLHQRLRAGGREGSNAIR
jgi:hypothetical protein